MSRAAAVAAAHRFGGAADEMDDPITRCSRAQTRARGPDDTPGERGDLTLFREEFYRS